MNPATPGGTVSAECGCGLPLEPPAGTRHWHPDLDAEPRGVAVVVRFGEDAQFRRAVRVDGGWAEHGYLVNYYADRTPPMTWAECGTCWAGTRHPVVAAEAQMQNGRSHSKPWKGIEI